MEQIIPIEILLVEDNPVDANLTLRALQRRKLANRVKVVEDGEEALDYLCKRGIYCEPEDNMLPRVVFLDLKLPKLNGLQVLKEIRSYPATRNLPVVILTSSREDPDIQRAYNLGANSYVIKPINFETFTQAIADLGMYWVVLNEPPR